jgi:prolyl-tRNA synthetase
VRSIEALTQFLNVTAAQCIKTLLVEGVEDDVIAIVVRGDHEMNALKAQKLPGVATPLRMASAERIRSATGCEPGFIGPVGLELKVYADHSAIAAANFVCGANERDAHLVDVNWGRDLAEPVAADVRNVVAGDPSPNGRGRLRIARGIEVGHIFQLGAKYSEALSATVLDEQGRDVVMLMGCYGIGVTRVVAAAIEQNHDERGIIWPEPLTPFDVALVPINLQKSPRVAEVAERLHSDLEASGFSVLYDDRDARPGVKFADSELLGIPHRIVVGDKGLERGMLEYRHRRAAESLDAPLAEVVEFLRARSAVRR